MNLKHVAPKMASIALMFATFTLGGCGNTVDRRPTSSSVTAAASVVSGEWRCPDYGVYNLKAPSGTVVTEMAFSVCRAATNGGKFLIDGYSAATTVCFYPMKANTSAGVAQQNGLRKCFNVKNGPVVAQFDALDSNYMYAVPSSSTTAMDAYIAGTGDVPPGMISGFLP
jgi:hypothetical protein